MPDQKPVLTSFNYFYSRHSKPLNVVGNKPSAETRFGVEARCTRSFPACLRSIACGLCACDRLSGAACATAECVPLESGLLQPQASGCPARPCPSTPMRAAMSRARVARRLESFIRRQRFGVRLRAKLYLCIGECDPNGSPCRFLPGQTLWTRPLCM
jgi:hypothetical protein